jgi:rRNA-processing protein FCF1
MASHRIILDSGAVTALATGQEAIRFALAKALRQKLQIIIPSVVVAESTTTGGPRGAAVNRALKIGLIVDCDVTIARAAAATRYADGARSGVIDAIVVATADQIAGSVILTGDLGDLGRLAVVRDVSRVVDISNLSVRDS